MIRQRPTSARLRTPRSVIFPRNPRSVHDGITAPTCIRILALKVWLYAAIELNQLIAPLGCATQSLFAGWVALGRSPSGMRSASRVHTTIAIRAAAIPYVGAMISGSSVVPRLVEWASLVWIALPSWLRIDLRSAATTPAELDVAKSATALPMSSTYATRSSRASSSIRATLASACNAVHQSTALMHDPPTIGLLPTV